MSRSDRERRDAERAARRARRLADRAEQRAQRKGQQAKRTADRAEELARRAHRRQSPRERDLDKSIEDFVDDVAETWSRKAEEWIDEKSQKMFDEQSGSHGSDTMDGLDSAEVEASKARRAARKARQATEEAAEFASRSSGQEYRSSRRTKRGKSKRQYRSYGNADFRRWGRTKWRRHGYGLYRDNKNKKICGVCAGSAEYLGVETWQVRLGALCGLFFLPSIAVPAYFITYFLMDKKPYYREVTDRFDQGHQREDEHMRPSMRERKSENRVNKPRISNVQAMSTAKRKFADIEDKLRCMETHVTSSKFELQREFKKISGED